MCSFGVGGFILKGGGVVVVSVVAVPAAALVASHFEVCAFQEWMLS